MSLWAIKNDEGKYQTECAGDLWRELGDDTEVYGEKFDAMEDAREFGGHVVELTEAPAKVVVSEEEAEMLERAKDSCWPAHIFDCGAAGATINSQDRLMRAYVIGWTVEKPKRYFVRVPHAEEGTFYRKDVMGEETGILTGQSWAKGYDPKNYMFTDLEIIKYGLQDCEKEEVADDDD